MKENPKIKFGEAKDNQVEAPVVSEIQTACNSQLIGLEEGICIAEEHETTDNNLDFVLVIESRDGLVHNEKYNDKQATGR